MAHIKERTTRRGTKFDVCRGTESRTYPTLETALLAQIAVERGDRWPSNQVLPDSTTVGEFMVEFNQRWKLGKAPKTIEIARNAVANMRSLRDVRLSQVTASMVEDAIAVRADIAPRSAQQALAHLQRAMRSAQDRGHTIDPRILKLKAPVYESREIRFLDWAEVEALQSFVDERVNRIVPFAALTGMRKGELFDLTDTRCDLSDGSVTLRKTKTGKPRKVWLSDHARQLLREQLVARTPNAKGLVFATRTGHRLDSRFERGYREAVQHAGLTGTTFHSLRHTCAALMIRAECNPLEIAEQLGHMRAGKPDPTMIWQRYGWLYRNATQNAVKKLDGLILDERQEETA